MMRIWHLSVAYIGPKLRTEPVGGRPAVASLLKLMVMEVVITTGTIRRANYNHQQTNTQLK